MLQSFDTSSYIWEKSYTRKILRFQKILLKKTLSQILLGEFCVQSKTSQEMKLFVKILFIKFEQIHTFLRICWYLLKNSWWKILFIYLFIYLFVYSPLVILINVRNCMIFLSPFLDFVRIPILTDSFLSQLNSGIMYLLNAFLWPVLLNNFKFRINRHNLSLGSS